MKPAFALNLTQDGLGLLHRSGTGWARVGDVSFEDDDLDGALARLRAEAHRIEPDGLATKVILPESQILYTEIAAPGPHAAEREAQIARALKGRTPYEVSELAFDWAEIGGGMVQVAVVARLTLAEAEEFAEAQGFNPVSFVALPQPDQFSGEPFFGETAKATARLFGKLTRDSVPVSLPPVPVAEAEPEPVPEEVSGGVTSGNISDSEHIAPLDTAEPGDIVTQAIIPEDPDAISPNPVPTPAPAVASGTATEPDRTEEAPFIAVEDEAEEPAASFTTRRSAAPAPSDEVPAPVAKRLHLAEGDAPMAAPGPVVEAVAVTAPGLQVPPPVEAPLPETKLRAPRALPSTLPDARHGTQAQIRARRSEMGREASPAEEVRDRAASALSSIPVKPVAIGAGVIALLALAASLFFGGDDPAPEAPAASGAIEAPAQAEVATAAPAPAVPAPAATPQPAPAEVASPTAAPAETAAAEAPVPAEPAAPATAPAPELPPDIAPPAAVFTTAPEGVAAPEADPGLSAKPAPGANAEAALAAPEGLDTASRDDSGLSRQPLPPPFGEKITFGPDGLIVPTPEGVITPDGFALYEGAPPLVPSRRPGSEPLPVPEAAAPAAGADPLPAPVDPAHAARKPLLRPASIATAAAEAARLAAEAEAAAAAAATIVPPTPAEVAAPAAMPQPVDPAHAARKPRARPAAIESRAEASRAQAEAIAAAAEAAARAEAAASVLAVKSSRRPADRPSGIEKAVEDAVASAVADAAAAAAAAAPKPAPEPAVSTPKPEQASAQPAEEIDEPEPTGAMPNIPTTVTVAKQATMKNVIDLGDVNLIGVYGSSSNRRALVRMPTGRLLKVKIGDRLDGGKVAAIGENELTYVKNGRSFTLKIQGRG